VREVAPAVARPQAPGQLASVLGGLLPLVDSLAARPRLVLVAGGLALAWMFVWLVRHQGVSALTGLVLSVLD